MKPDKPKLNQPRAFGFECYYLYTRPGSIVSVNEGGKEVRYPHRPKFIRAIANIEGNRFVVSPKRRRAADNQNLIAFSASSIQQINLISASRKHQSFFPLLLGLASLFLLVWEDLRRSIVNGIESFVDGFWETDPHLLRIGGAILLFLLCCVYWYWQVLHNLWRKLVYSQITVRTKKKTYVLYVRPGKQAEVAAGMLQIGLPVRDSILLED